MRNANLLAAAALMGLASMPAVGGSVEVLPRGFGYAPPDLESRRNGYRKGRRWGYGMPSWMRGRNDNPAGTKLAKKAAKGTLTINGIK